MKYMSIDELSIIESSKQHLFINNTIQVYSFYATLLFSSTVQYSTVQYYAICHVFMLTYRQTGIIVSFICLCISISISAYIHMTDMSYVVSKHSTNDHHD